ncbi:MAG: Proteasome assembly chaperone (PAC2) family protein [Chloroflexi bacterium]|nr:MAG: Proteasome assembly chaperone (PAC2) family protein [Chloroflexota bacterium]
MSALTFHDRPELRDPVMVLAFLGWNDAAESASGVIRYLRRKARTERLAEIDPDEFFVFTEDRPHVRLRDSRTREIRWPLTDFTPARFEGAERDFILGLGTEPHLRWKAFSAHVAEVALELGVSEIITVGGLLADTPHTRPVPVSGSAHPLERMQELGFEPSSYQGPTGIVGAIGDMCREQDIAHVGLWASVPHYVSGGQNPRATQALLTQLNEIYALGLDLSDLEGRARRYDAQVAEALKDNSEMREYVQKLEASAEPSDEGAGAAAEATPERLSSTDALKEIDRMLRGDEEETA